RRPRVSGAAPPPGPAWVSGAGDAPASTAGGPALGLAGRAPWRGARRSAMEVRGQAGPAALPPDPGLLVPAKRAGRVEPVVGVGPHHARAQLLCHGQDPAAFLR